jgi:hypothetical protein
VQGGRGLLVLPQRGHFVQRQIQRLDTFPFEAPASQCGARAAGGPAGPLRGVRAEQRGAGRQIDKNQPTKPVLIDSR